MLKEQLSKRREEKEKKKKGPRTDTTLEDEDLEQGNENEPFSVEYVSKHFTIENGLFPFKGSCQQFWGPPFARSSGKSSLRGYSRLEQM